MRTTLSILLSLLTLSSQALSLPIPSKRTIVQSRQNNQVFPDTTFNEITISGGTAGNAEAEALAVFSVLADIDPADLSETDISFLNEVNQICNDAETDAFNTAIDNASDDDEELALQNGKIKNKVLKLMATRFKLEAQIAQGDTDLLEKLDDEIVKLNNNIATDQEHAGEPSTALDFDAVISGEN